MKHFYKSTFKYWNIFNIQNINKQINKNVLLNKTHFDLPCPMSHSSQLEENKLHYSLHPFSMLQAFGYISQYDQENSFYCLFYNMSSQWLCVDVRTCWYCTPLELLIIWLNPHNASYYELWSNWNLIFATCLNAF